MDLQKRIISAKEAREIVNFKIKLDTDEKVERICAKVFEAATKGESILYLDIKPNPYVREKLKDLGYKIEEVNSWNSKMVYIKW